MFTTVSLPGKPFVPLNGCDGCAHSDSTVTSWVTVCVTKE